MLLALLPCIKVWDTFSITYKEIEKYMETIIGTTGIYYALDVWLLFGIPTAILLIVNSGLIMASPFGSEKSAIICIILAIILTIVLLILGIFAKQIFEYTTWYEIYIEDPNYINSLEFNKKYIIKEKKTENIYIVEKRE